MDIRSASLQHHNGNACVRMRTLNPIFQWFLLGKIYEVFGWTALFIIYLEIGQIKFLTFITDFKQWQFVRNPFRLWFSVLAIDGFSHSIHNAWFVFPSGIVLSFVSKSSVFVEYSAIVTSGLVISHFIYGVSILVQSFEHKANQYCNISVVKY